MEISSNKEYRTVSGQLVRIYTVYPTQNEYNVHGAICDNDVWEAMQWSSLDGSAAMCSPDYDLVEHVDFVIDRFKLNADYVLKQVNYFGRDFLLPRKIKYLATDGNGDIRGFTQRPNTNDLIVGKWKSSNEENARFIATSEYQGNWRRSLQEV